MRAVAGKPGARGPHTSEKMRPGAARGGAEHGVQVSQVVSGDDRAGQVSAGERQRRARLWRALRWGLSARWLGVLALLASVAAIFLVWRYTPLTRYLELEELLRLGREIQALPFAPLAILGGYVVAVALAMPVAILISVASILFGPWVGMAYALGGLLCGAHVTYGVGRLAGARFVERVSSERFQALAAKLRERGLATVLFVRLVPVAPFLLVNVAAGALRVRLRDYFLGSLLGMLPGVILITWFTDRLAAALRDPGPGSFAMLGGIVLLAIALLVFVRRRVARHRAA